MNFSLKDNEQHTDENCRNDTAEILKRIPKNLTVSGAASEKSGPCDKHYAGCSDCIAACVDLGRLYIRFSGIGDCRNFCGLLRFI